MKKLKLLQRALSGAKNFPFDDFVTLVEAFGFRRDRIRGSHHLFFHPEVPEVLNLQNVRGQAKPYQIRQFLRLVERYNLRLGEEP